ncbi:conserved hypothetical protein [Sporisorium reilianum SRZ2]|uniref:Uncharacterized protein n=1 Tax=Sporisorium reilianum (strain SRZ2) TaxID=999809 RepID=E6ZN35_SPORE|nr:conserved hypothetical protein [Sporisorium reilianum SRZ2]
MSASLHGHPFQLQSHARADHLYPSPATSSRAGPSTHRRSPKPSKSPSPATLSYDTASTSPAQPKSTHLGSELYDAIVQAADPKHPDHAAWHHRYGSLSNRSSRASVTSNAKRDKLAASSPATPSSHNSLEHADPFTRRKHTPRNAGYWDRTYRPPHEAEGSDADDPLSNEGRYTPVRASFEGSVRPLHASSIASSSYRRRNRKLRDSPKPLDPPVPPPRITSSTNWQSTFGSPSLPELSTSSPRMQSGRPSASIATSDSHDQPHQKANAQRLFASPTASPPLRMAHPYASASDFEGPQKHDLKSLPSLPAVAQSNYQLQEAASHFKRDRLPLQTSASTNSIRSARVANDGPIIHAKSSLRLARQPSAIAPASSLPPLYNSAMQDTLAPYASNHSAVASKSMSKIRQLLGPETPELAGASFPSKTNSTGEAHDANTSQASAPATPPKDNARAQPLTSAFVTRNPRAAQQATPVRSSEEQSRNVDLDIFPLRRDDEFCANDFESSDELEAEDSSAATQLPPTTFQYTSSAATRSDRGPGVVRRSLDSIISPFRAGLLNGVSSGMGRTSAASASTTSLAAPAHQTIAEGRRSFSDSRFVRPFLPRTRNATLGRHARPLSKVLDRPDDELDEIPYPAGDQRDQSNPSGASMADSQAFRNSEGATMQDTVAAKISMREASADQSRPQESLPSMTSSRSLASTYSRSTSNLRYMPDGAKLQQRQRTKLGGLFTRVKGSMAPKGISQEFSPYAPSPSTSTLHQSPPGAALSLPTSPPTSVGAASAPTIPAKKAERPFRFRVKSLTSLSTSRSKDEIVHVPPVPAIPANYVTPEMEATRSVWEESPRVPQSSSFASEKGSRTLGRLLRRKKVNEDTDVSIDSFVPLPPKLSHPHIAEEAAPRPSVSSARGFDVVESSSSAPNIAQTRTTIRKTLSPTLLSDSSHPGIEATFADAEVISVGHGKASGSNGQGRSGESSQLLPREHGAVEESSEVGDDQQSFRSPLGRFIRHNSAADRLSRVEELSERLSYIADVNEPSGIRTLASMPPSLSKGPSPRSFGEHRWARRNIGGIQHGQASPSALDLADTKDSRARKGSLDILRPGNKRGGATALDSPASMSSSALTSPAAPKFASTPKSPAASSWSEQRAPSWRSTGLNASRGRTSFSQDRDRAPVASPISPALPPSRGVGQAIKRLGIKGKSSKGIGPTDLIVLNFDDDGDQAEIIADTSSRPSMSAEPRGSFGGGARPSFSSTARSPFVSSRPSFDTTARNGLTASDSASKLSDFETSGLIPSPVDPSFGSSKEVIKQVSNDPSRGAASLNRIHTDGDARSGGSQVAGLGIGSVQWSEAMPPHKGEGVDMPGSASDGTFTTRGVHTPENGSLSHSYSSQLPTRTDSTGATSLTADRASMDVGSQPAAPLKSAELLAFEDMLGRFPQQQKVLLQDISARVAQTPLVGAGGSGSREDVSSFPPFATS